MLKLWLYITSFIKFLILWAIVSGIVTYFWPVPGRIVFVVGLLGIFGATKDDVAEKYEEILKKREHKRKLKVAEDSKDEFEGFEQAVTLTRRNMQ